MDLQANRELLIQIRRELIRQSTLALGRTAPNPAVGCVALSLCKAARLFVGGTEVAGGRHAEIVALDSYDGRKERSPGEELHLFVTLEPCSKFGRTPPCAERLISYSELKRVEILCPDPSLDNGGINQLREHGVEVCVAGSGEANNITGLELSPEDARLGRAFLNGFFSRLRGDGPRLHFKAALTPDGYMSQSPDAGRLLISGEMAQRLTMVLRTKLDGVLVGPGTVACDLPRLDLRPLFRRGPKDANLPLVAERVSGSDLLIDSFLKHAAEIEAMQQELPEFQPKRIFILGRPFTGEIEFLKNQQLLEATTGRMPIYYAVESDADYWRKRVALRAVLPEMGSSDFAGELSAALAADELNDVMVEGGAGLMEALSAEKLTESRVYLLISKEKFPVEELKGGRRLPDKFNQLREVARYDLGEDFLVVKGAPD